MYSVVWSIRCVAVFQGFCCSPRGVVGWEEKIFFFAEDLEAKHKTRGTFRRIFRCPRYHRIAFLGANFDIL